HHSLCFHHYLFFLLRLLLVRGLHSFPTRRSSDLGDGPAPLHDARAHRARSAADERLHREDPPLRGRPRRIPRHRLPAQPGGLTTMTARALDELPSRNPDGAFRAAERTDPYWGGMFATGISDGWVSASQYRRATEEQKRWAGVPASFATLPDEALALLRTNRHGPAFPGSLVAVASSPTLSGEQLAATPGSAVMARTYPASLSAPFSAGLLSHGHVSAGMNRLAPARDRM